MAEDVQGNSHEPSPGEYDRLTPDVRALMVAAKAKTRTDRSERRAAARARAEAARLRKNNQRKGRDRATLAALVILIVALWVVAALVVRWGMPI